MSTDLLDQILGGDFSGIEDSLTPAQKREREKTQTDWDRRVSDLAHCAASALGSPEGAELMRWLEEQTIRMPTILPGAIAAKGYHIGLEQLMIFREGQNSVYRMLEGLINKAREG
jgi:hypothetical protein